MAKKRYSKVEEEIIQILDAADRKSKPRRWAPRRRRIPRLPQLPDGPRMNAGLLRIGGSFALAFLAILVADWSSTLALLLAILSLVLFLSPVARAFRRTPPEPTVRRWRGRDIEIPPRPVGFFGQLRHLLWRLRNRR